MSSIFLHEMKGRICNVNGRVHKLHTCMTYVHHTNFNGPSDVLTDFFRVLPCAVEYSASLSSSAVVPKPFCRWDDLAVLKAVVEVRSRLFFSGLRLEDCELHINNTESQIHRCTQQVQHLMYRLAYKKESFHCCNQTVCIWYNCKLAYDTKSQRCCLECM